MAGSAERWREPGMLGGVRVKNRIVYPPLSGNCARVDGGVSPDILSLYRRIAKGGCGVTVVSGAAVSNEGKGSDRTLCLYDRERHLAGYARLAAMVRREDCFAALQLMHVGGQGNPNYMGGVPVSPSGGHCSATGFDSRALTREETRVIRDDFVHAAVLASEAGFDAVELHLAHGYLLHEFLSRHSNRREDEYGGDLDGRVLLVSEIVSGIREAAPDLIIGARVSGHDYLADGLGPADNRELLPRLEAAGIAWFSVTAGVYETSEIKHREMKAGRFFDLARGIRSMVRSPVIGVGKVLDIEAAEAHLAAGDCDFVAMGRALLADPDLVVKVQQGRPHDRCIECHRCMYHRLGRQDLYCPVLEGTNVPAPIEAPSCESAVS